MHPSTLGKVLDVTRLLSLYLFSVILLDCFELLLLQQNQCGLNDIKFCLQGTEKVLHVIQEEFPDLEIISLSGNICTDKKPAAMNWLVKCLMSVYQCVTKH